MGPISRSSRNQDWFASSLQALSSNVLLPHSSLSKACTIRTLLTATSTPSAIALHSSSTMIINRTDKHHCGTPTIRPICRKPSSTQQYQTANLKHGCYSPVRWKSQIAAHQQQVRESQPPQQTTLFEIAQVHCDPETIDPLTLQLQAMSFYRMPTDSPGDSCLYFVIDSAAGLILYVGETCRSNKRWKGLHDCKGYIESYQDLHYRYGLQTAVNIAFWWDSLHSDAYGRN